MAAKATVELNGKREAKNQEQLFTRCHLIIGICEQSLVLSGSDPCCSFSPSITQHSGSPPSLPLSLVHQAAEVPEKWPPELKNCDLFALKELFAAVFLLTYGDLQVGPSLAPSPRASESY